MRNRRLLWCLGASVFLLLAGFALFVVVRVLPDRITPENCDRIEVGMTQGEVETILGRSADREDLLETGSLPKTSMWVGERWAIRVEFDGHGVVSWKIYWDRAEDPSVGGAQPSPILLAEVPPLSRLVNDLLRGPPPC